MLDQYMQRLQNISPFNIHAILPDGNHEPWYNVDGSIVQDLVIRETDLALQVQTVSAQIAHWGRMAAQTKRVWEMEERGYRAWRSRFFLEQKGKDKPPTEKAIEALYRIDDEYAVWQTQIERAEEAHDSSKSIYEAFKAKRDMLRATIYRSRDDGSVSMSV